MICIATPFTQKQAFLSLKDFHFILSRCAKLLHLYLTLCNTMDHSLPGFSVHRILPARYWSGLPCPPPEDVPDRGINTRLLSLLHWQAASFPGCHLGSPLKQLHIVNMTFSPEPSHKSLSSASNPRELKYSKDSKFYVANTTGSLARRSVIKKFTLKFDEVTFFLSYKHPLFLERENGSTDLLQCLNLYL